MMIGSICAGKATVETCYFFFETVRGLNTWSWLEFPTVEAVILVVLTQASTVCCPVVTAGHENLKGQSLRVTKRALSESGAGKGNRGWRMGDVH